MKKYCLFLFATFTLSAIVASSQDLKSSEISATLKLALLKKYPEAKMVTWEKEKGSYEANWGGKSGEENSVQLTPSGEFIEISKAIAISELPQSVLAYVKQHFKGAKITEANRVTDAKGKITYEAEVNRKEIIFDEKGNFIKTEH